MTVPRAIFNQEEERVNLAIDKIRREVFRFDADNLYSIDELCKKLPKFNKLEIRAAIDKLLKKDLLIFKQQGDIYYGEKYSK